ncbi:MAG: hypothetical protein J6R37_03285 [Clostridia bacterium]|nr:hypothetical protein [Clostridia bacterium]
MEDYVGATQQQANACDTDWLEITYAKRKYVNKKPKKAQKSNKRRIIATSLVAVFLLLAVGVVIADTAMGGEFIETAQTMFTATFFGQTTDISNTIVVPAWWEVESVQNGKVSFMGGSLALCLEQGTVSNVGENSVTVSVDENTLFVYENLEEIFVKVGDVVNQYDVLGECSSLTLTVYYQQQVVQNVVANGTEVSWKV